MCMYEVQSLQIRTDHASLQYLTSITDVADQMFRWILFLEQYSYAIEIRKGIDHANADTLITHALQRKNMYLR